MRKNNLQHTFFDKIIVYKERILKEINFRWRFKKQNGVNAIAGGKSVSEK